MKKSICIRIFCPRGDDHECAGYCRTLGWNFEYSGREIKACFHVSRSGDSWTTKMDSPDQGQRGLLGNGVRGWRVDHHGTGPWDEILREMAGGPIGYKELSCKAG